MKDIRIVENGPTFSVTCPYLPDFTKRANELNGRWDREERTWAFPARHRERILRLLDELYAYDEAETKSAVVELTVADYELSVWQDAIRILGRVVASASGRDSGARVGKDVALIKGKFGSGGSHVNWETIITPGTIFEMVLPHNAA